MSLFEASLLLKIYLLDWVIKKTYRQEIVCFEVDSSVMLLDVLSSFAISYELGYFTPVPKAVS